MEAKLLEGLKRAIRALNMKTNFKTTEGIKSYELLGQLDALVREAEANKVSRRTRRERVVSVPTTTRTENPMVTATAKVWYAKNSNPPREVSPEVGKRQAAEWAVVSAFVRTALKAGHTLGVYDGEELVLKHSSSYKAVMAAIMSTDEDQIIVYPVGATSGKRMGWVALTYGNDGPDVISDYTTNLEHLMGLAEQVSDRLYLKWSY